jgi:hypothetical protein
MRLDTFLGWVGLLLIGIIGWTCDRLANRSAWKKPALDHAIRRT